METSDEPSTKKITGKGVHYSPVDRNFVAGRNIKPVSHKLIDKLAKEGKLPQSLQHVNNSVGVSFNIECLEEEQPCLNGSFIDNVMDNDNYDIGNVTNNMTLHDNECSTCLKQFSNKSNFTKHTKKDDCKEVICKKEHGHDYKIIKFETIEALKEFSKSFGNQFQIRTPKSQVNIKAYCREKGCQAHWYSKETDRPSGSIDFVFRGCVQHALDCKHHEANKGKPKPDRKTHKRYALKQTFSNWRDAMTYFYEKSQDSVFLLDKLKLNRDGAPLYKHFKCHRSGEPLLINGSKYNSKKTGCISKCSLRQTTKGIELAGNYQHNHEEFDKAKLGQIQSEYVQKLVRMGRGNLDIVMDEIINHPEDVPMGKFINRRVAYQVKRDKVQIGECDLKLKEGPNIHNLFAKHKAFVAHQTRRFFGPPPANIADREIKTTNENILLAHCSDRMLKLFKQNPRNIYVDGTHNTNQAGYPLITVMVPNKFGVHEAILQVVTEHEDTDMIKDVFKVLNKLAPDAMSQVRTLTADMHHGYIKAFREVVGDNGPDYRVRYIPCKWHVERAWTNNIKSERLLNDLKSLILVPKPNVFEATWAQLEEKYLNSEEGNERQEWLYFINTYGYGGGQGHKVNPKEWARCYNLGAIPHNLHIEAYHSRIKDILSATRMDTALENILTYEKYARLWAKEREMGLPGKKESAIQKKFRAQHKGTSGYDIKRLGEGEYLVTKQGTGWREHKQYTVKLNDVQPCTDMLSCDVKCNDCGPQTVCWHTYSCECDGFSVITACKHQHMLPPEAYTDAIAWRLHERANEPQSAQENNQQSMINEPQSEESEIITAFDNISMEAEDILAAQREDNSSLTQTALQREANRLCVEMNMLYEVLKAAESQGSCFFDAIVIKAKHPDVYPSLSEDAKEAVRNNFTLRIRVVDMLENNIELEVNNYIENFKIAALELTDNESEEEKEQRWQDYLRKMRSPFTFADDTMVQATALYLRKDIMYVSNRHPSSERPWTVVEGTQEGSSFKSNLPPLTIAYLNQRHFEPIHRKTPAGPRDCHGCNWKGTSLQNHLATEVATEKKCKYFYPDAGTANVQVSTVDATEQPPVTANEQVSEENTLERTLSEEDTLLVRELENAKNKLLQGVYNKYDKEGLYDFFGNKGSTPKKVKKSRKRKERDESADELASQYPMAIPKKKAKKHKEPKRNGEFMNDKNAKDLLELLEVPTDELFWCFEVCKGINNFRSKVLNLEPEVSKKLFKMFREADSHFKCQKCETHSVELAMTQFIWCDRCNAIFHGRCAGKDLDDEKVRAADYICELCNDHIG